MTLCVTMNHDYPVGVERSSDSIITSVIRFTGGGWWFCVGRTHVGRDQHSCVHLARLVLGWVTSRHLGN